MHFAADMMHFYDRKPYTVILLISSPLLFISPGDIKNALAD